MKRLLLSLFLILGSCSAWAANLDYRALLTNYFTTNIPSAFYVGINTNPGSSTYQFVTNLIQNNASPQVWTNISPGNLVLRSTSPDAGGNYLIAQSTNGSVIFVGENFINLPSGGANTVIGFNGMFSGAGADNALVGWGVMNSVNGSQNSALGSTALDSTGPLTNCTGVGYSAGVSLNAANGITAIGALSLQSDSDGSENTAVGFSSGGTITLGSSNTFLGFLADGTATGTNQTVIGNRAKATLNNQVVLGNDSALTYRIGGKNYNVPITNALAGQALVSDGNTPQQLSWATFTSGITGGTTNFATTNTDIGLTNAIQSIATNFTTTTAFTNEIKSISTNVAVNTFSNQIPNFIHGTTNRIAKFTPNTNEVGDSLAIEISSNTWAWNKPDSGTRTNQFTNMIYGEFTSEANFARLDIVSATPNANTFNEIKGTVGSSGSQIAPLKLMNTLTIEPSANQISGHQASLVAPVTSDTDDLGTSSLAFKNFNMTRTLSYIGSSGKIDANQWQVVFPTTSIDFYRNVSASATLSTRFGTVGSTSVLGWDFAGNLLGFGTGVGSDTSFIGVSASSNLGEVQLGTNNAGAATPQKVTLTGAIGTGSNHGGSSIDHRPGYGTGTARNGDFTISTAPSTAGSGTTANNSYITNFYISSQPVTLTESSATLVFNVSVPSGKVVGFTVDATVEANDSTDFESQHDVFSVAAVNKGGTVTTGISTSYGSANAISSVSTLVTTWTAVANGNGVDVKCNAVSGLTQTTLRVLGGYIIHLQGSGQSVITPQ